MLHGGAHISSSKRQRRVDAYKPPDYHWRGFGRQASKPSWYDGNRDRKDLILWEGDACGCPRVVPKKLGKKPPYNHSSDPRIYRPVVPQSRTQLTTLVRAGKADRQLISRGNDRMDMTGRYVEHGVAEKYGSYLRQSVESREIFENNKEKNVYTDMKSIIFARHDMTDILPYSRTRTDFKVGGGE
ncbi:hypothetical protein TrCOL_g858 [Triparma columacea]|uniref:Uncharacterized protein n=1 Tax=Triparma columacea TaxID=722753 RepID=A0A9W7GJJ4_9STRA|nr:hypothetical protein TrCOL_g858 [Triparma columacea]